MRRKEEKFHIMAPIYMQFLGVSVGRHFTYINNDNVCLPSLFLIWWEHDACYYFCLNINTLSDGKPTGQQINLEARQQFF